MSRFNLPVFKGGEDATAAEVLRLSLRAEEAFDATLGERINLDFGVAIVSEEFPDVPSGNHVRDVVMPRDRALEDVIAEVDALFAARSRRCRCWIFADGRVSPEMRQVLLGRGYLYDAGKLLQSVRPPQLRERTDLTIIPGRASFEKLADLFEASHDFTNESVRMQFRQATARRLDDTRVDNLLVLEGTVPVGTLYFVTMGQLGFVTQFFVRPESRRKGIGSTLLARALELGARSRVRHVTLFCDEGNAAAEGLYRRGGFEVVAEVESMEAGGTAV